MRAVRSTSSIAILLLVVLSAGCGEDKPLIKPGNRAPVIHSLVAQPDTVALRAGSTLTVDASDADGDSLQYSWSLPGGGGHFTDAGLHAATAHWTAPDSARSVTIQVDVTDGELSASASTTIEVKVPTADLLGTVLDSGTSAGIPGVRVSAGGVADTTDAAGHYYMLLPSGQIELRAEKVGFESWTGVVTVVADHINTFNITLEVVTPKTELSGTVTNSLSQAIAGAVCQIGGEETQTGSDGAYRFPPIAVGSYTLSISAPGYAAFTDSVALEEPEQTRDVELDAIPLPAPTALRAEEGSDGLTITVSWNPPSITGTLTGYRLYIRDGAGAYTPVQQAPLPTTPRSFATIGAVDHRYSFMVAGINFEGEEGNPSAPSNTVVLTPLSTFVPIPAGALIMGDTPAGWGTEVHPGNPVSIPAFRIEQTEVTNRQYVAFLYEVLSKGQISANDSSVVADGHPLLLLNASKIDYGGDPLEFSIVPGYETDPVVGVTWYGADAYARTNGRRLPTEAEWEMAARGTSTEHGDDGAGHGFGNKYPWGTEPPTATRANFANFYGRTQPVRSFEPGAATDWSAPLYNMAGNAWEWCADWFAAYRDPHTPPSTGSAKVLRGGGYRDNASFLRAAARFSIDPEAASSSTGFRCAGDPE